jgi:hypothetical protein
MTNCARSDSRPPMRKIVAVAVTLNIDAINTVGAQKDCIFFHSPPPTQNHTKTADSVAQKSDFFKGIIKLQNNDFFEFFP